MERAVGSSAVRVGAAADGTKTYLIDLPPEALPPVRPRDLASAWDQARDAAIEARWDVAHLFRFRREDGSLVDLALTDGDACCWAAAVERTVGMGSSYGISLVMRLLALIDMLARVPLETGWCILRRDGAEIDRRVLGAAATLPLTREGRFDETGFADRLTPPPIARTGIPFAGALA